MDVVVTHGDRARLSPLNSCSMKCVFCNIPYDHPLSTYQLEPIDQCLAALRLAVKDHRQPARHILISGGTPKPKDVPNHQELYRRVIESFPDVPVDIMMVPIPGILNLSELDRIGLGELSINLEVYDQRRQQSVARQKYNWGRSYYLDFIERAAEELGAGRVRSMLLVGLEPIESTLQGVEAIARRGGVPVLSPFRPDPVTPLRDTKPPTYGELLRVLALSEEIVAKHATFLGPACPPCTHNTLNFGCAIDGQVQYQHPHPRMLGAKIDA
jgi:2-iminoacetate synthase ThiH